MAKCNEIITDVWLKLPVAFFENDTVDFLMSNFGSDYVFLYQCLFIEAVKLQKYRLDDNCITNYILQFYEYDFVKDALKVYNELHIDSIANNWLIPKFKRVDYRNRNCPEYREWRNAVFTRDNYVCQICGGKNVQLNAHHIKPWAKREDLRFNVDNGITLCVHCHKNIHRKGGIGNNV